MSLKTTMMIITGYPTARDALADVDRRTGQPRRSKAPAEQGSLPESPAAGGVESGKGRNPTLSKDLPGSVSRCRRRCSC